MTIMISLELGNSLPEREAEPPFLQEARGLTRPISHIGPISPIRPAAHRSPPL
jgi:hypothetical protein